MDTNTVAQIINALRAKLVRQQQAVKSTEAQLTVWENQLKKA